MESEAEFRVASGILLVPGVETVLASMGDRRLVARATYVPDAVDPAR